MTGQQKLSERIKARLDDEQPIVPSEVYGFHKEAEWLEKQLADQQASNQRMRDLVRYKRHDLFNDDLIDQSEFASLVAETPGAVERLEGYDKIKAQLAEAQNRIQELETIAAGDMISRNRLKDERDKAIRERDSRDPTNRSELDLEFLRVQAELSESIRKLAEAQWKEQQLQKTIDSMILEEKTAAKVKTMIETQLAEAQAEAYKAYSDSAALLAHAHRERDQAIRERDEARLQVDALMGKEAAVHLGAQAAIAALRQCEAVQAQRDALAKLLRDADKALKQIAFYTPVLIHFGKRICDVEQVYMLKQIAADAREAIAALERPAPADGGKA